MPITHEHLEAIRGGEAVRLTEDGTELVVLRADLFERLRSSVSDATVFTTAEMLDRVMADDDANDPHLAELQVRYGGTRP